MRTALFAPFLVALLTSALLAGEDEWKVERPKSKPEGDPIALRFARTKDTVVRGELTRTTTESTPAGRETNEMVLALRMSFGEVNDDGHTPIHVSVKLKRYVQDGEDLTGALPTTEGTLAALLEPTGKFVTGVDARGVGQMFTGDVSQLIVAGGDRTVRKGEVWDVATKEVAGGLRSVKAKNVAVESFATLEDVEERDGVRCARIRSVTVGRLDGVQLKGFTDGKIRMRSERVEWLGLDGILRYRTEKLTARIVLGDDTIEIDTKNVVKAGPETSEEK